MLGLIVPGTLKYCPYVNYYIHAFRSVGIPFEILSWDKVGLSESTDYAFHYITKDSTMIRKTIGYIKFRNWVIAICKKRKYDKLIVFTLAPAMMMYAFLKKEYAGKYYLDIRDDTILRKYFGKSIKSLIDDAAGVVSSSREFECWIGRSSTMCHNVDVAMIQKAIETSNSDEYTVDGNVARGNRIMFAGMLNEWKINLELVERMGNRDDVSFVFHAPDSLGKANIQEFCNNNQIRNVSFFGAYKKEEIHDLYRQDADWANIIRCESVVNRNALPNKLYDAIVSGTPVIVLDHNKAVSNYVKAYHLGLVFDDVEEMENEFVNRARMFDWKAFHAGRMEFLSAVLSECILFHETVVSWNA